MRRLAFAPLARRLLPALLVLACLAPCGANAEDLPEFRLKAAFLYNFAAFTDWPPDTGPVLTLCVVGPDPFGAELDPLQGKRVGERTLAVQRQVTSEGLKGCQIAFLSSAPGSEPLGRLLDAARGLPLLTVADAPGAAARGAVLGLNLKQGRITFEANMKAARAGNLALSARLLRLATEVVQ